jgi:acetyl esterase/lipase
MSMSPVHQRAPRLRHFTLVVAVLGTAWLPLQPAEAAEGPAPAMRDRAAAAGDRAAAARGLLTAADTERVRAAIPEGVTWLPDLAYRDGDPAWRLDLAMPTERNGAPRPAIVVVHGGGWQGGDKRAAGGWWKYPLDFAAAGYVAVSVNYRLVPQARFPACLEDVRTAVRWLRAHAAEYHVDPARIGAYGNSAGAHLVALAALTADQAVSDGDAPWQQFPSTLQAVVAAATPTDLAVWRDSEPVPEPVRALLGAANATAGDIAALARPASPIAHVRADAPPLLLFHGTADTTVPYEQATRFIAALRQAGARHVDLVTYEGAGHNAYTAHLAQSQPRTLAFFAEHLRPGETR